MKSRIITIAFIGIFLISMNFVSADSIYNWRYKGPANEPSTSYYSGYWNSGSGVSNSGGSYVPVSQKLKTFRGPYTQVHVQNTASYPRPSSSPSPSSNNFQAGGGYRPSYGGYGYYGGYYGYSYYSPRYYGAGYSYSYYDSYYPGYYW